METLAQAPSPAVQAPHCRRIGGVTSLGLGMVLGTAGVALALTGLLRYSGGLIRMIGLEKVLSFNNLHYSFLVMFLALPAVLWALGRDLGHNLAVRNMHPVMASFRYSFGVQAGVWLIFLLTQVFFGDKTDAAMWAFGVLVVVLYLGLLSTFTFGLMMAFVVQKRQRGIKSF